ncbi:glycosyltransferase [Arenimonas caeni]|uniref:glycosyltransferase n=1 Tax=Arenimonas caeni TaxID=2058085 RepID=UPI002A36E4E2|nr:glycosyltransferase [Arenimonas caeni]MDY0022386.1 glycosyltransferase [Arenimonas caeni]
MLVVAHDFPPVRSPQSIRALAFARRLAAGAAEVHVLTRTALPGLSLPTLPDNVRVHRASPGAFESLLDRLVARRGGHAGAGDGVGDGSAGPAALNWKGRAVALARRAIDQLRFPDGRAAWVPAARRELAALCRASRPDVALLMHEPAACLLLAEPLSAAGVPWLADLADPVLAPYTPRQFRRAAARLEARVVAGAAAVAATNAATAELLSSRHGIARDAITVLPQGFGDAAVAPMPAGDGLQLVYTGRFYPFRDPAALLAAVVATPGVRLLLAGPEMPAEVLAAARAHPGAIVLAGELPHEATLALQTRADVLVGVGNAGTAQSPGKLQEYFGAARPILHVVHDAADPAPALLARTRRGLAVPAEPAAIGAALQDLLRAKREGGLAARFDLGDEAVADFHWDAISDRLAARLAAIAG